MSSLAYLWVWSPLLHTPYTSSSSHYHHFATHVHTIVACFAVVATLCPLFLVSTYIRTYIHIAYELSTSGLHSHVVMHDSMNNDASYAASNVHLKAYLIVQTSTCIKWRIIKQLAPVCRASRPAPVQHPTGRSVTLHIVKFKLFELYYWLELYYKNKVHKV